jgi:hypothetical protein
MIKESAVPLSGCTALVLALSKCGRRNRVNLVVCGAHARF